MSRSLSITAQITERDLALLRDLYKHRYLSVTQIQRLHFPSLQTAYRRLRALTALGCIQGFLAPPITEHIYHLAKPGARFIAGDLGLPFEDLNWRPQTREPKDYYFLRHFLAINDFRITLQRGLKHRDDLSLLGFIPEYVGQGNSDRNTVAKYLKETVCDVANRQQRISHTPDAVFALEKAAQPALFFLEIDRGTEVVGREDKGVLKAARFYLSLLAGTEYQRYCRDFDCPPFKGFRALIVTTSEARVENISLAISTLSVPAKARQFIWLTDFSSVSESTIFQPIWRSGDAADVVRYRIS